MFAAFQIVIERVVKPQIEWLRRRASLSEALLTYRSDIVRQTLSQQAARYIQRQSAELYAAGGLLPWKQQISLNINRQINLILSPALSGVELSTERIYESLKILRKCNVRSSYTGRGLRDIRRIDLTGDVGDSLHTPESWGYPPGRSIQ
ncbi:hypothetical protein L21SP2_1566 [Salinispira pacifica]|uniref:Uncharacterized protein n=2 Tax=Salinispira pacifica TaxID=1307761 RepID=V5WH52_9SPIO|nr:hypothetical protein L21SP2_1566 [Salinispira pacifica]